MFRLSLLNNAFPALHGLRVIAVFVIVQVHMTSTAVFRGYPVGESLKWYSQALWPGMDFFFVLSGFLIGTIILYSLREESNFKIGRFYARRAFRIFPLYYVVLVFVSFLPQLPRPARYLGLFPHHEGINWRELVYLTNYPMDFSNVMYWSWSLSVEEHFYLLVPFLLLGLQAISSPRRRLYLLGALWLSCLLVKTAALLVNWKVLPTVFFREIYFTTHTRYDCLVAGIFAAYLHQMAPSRLSAFFTRGRGRALTWGLNLSLLALVLAQFSVSELAFRERTYYVKGAFIVGTPTSLCFAVLILWAVYDGGPLLGHSLMRKVATLSYGVYLIHIPVLEQLIFPTVVRGGLSRGYSFLACWWVGYLVALPTILLFAYFFHLAVEKPMLVLRERVAPSVSGPIALNPISPEDDLSDQKETANQAQSDPG